MEKMYWPGLKCHSLGAKFRRYTFQVRAFATWVRILLPLISNDFKTGRVRSRFSFNANTFLRKSTGVHPFEFLISLSVQSGGDRVDAQLP